MLVLASQRQAQAESTPAQAIVPLTMRGAVVEGSIDPPGNIEALLAGVAGQGMPFVDSGDADRVGMPIGTVPRLKHILEVIGYTADIAPLHLEDGVHLQVKLRAFDRVRRIFVSGNQPGILGGVRQEEIIGKLSIRPGMKLPSAGSDRDAFTATESDHVRDFLRSQGYWEAEVGIELHDDGKLPAGR
jgi:hypothetical protein